jgi:hypothetical protein
VDEELLRAIRDRDDLAIESLCHDEKCLNFFWVDWREEEESIVEYCAGCLQSEMLTTKRLDDKLVIVLNKTETFVPFEREPGDRHAVLCTLNEVLSPDFEIRMMVCSRGGDSLAFCVLPSTDWEQLDKEHPESTAENFLQYSPKLNLFTELTDHDLPPLAQARLRRMENRNRREPNIQLTQNGSSSGLPRGSTIGFFNWLSRLLGINKN